MNSPYDDHKIASVFRELRQAELEHTPRFSSLLKAAETRRPRYGLLVPAAGFAVVALVLSISATILLSPDNKGGAVDASNKPLSLAVSLQLDSIEEMPTDFLLETPWSQLASLGTETQWLDLPYEFLEELPDEP